MLLTREEFYKWLKVILKDGFYKNDDDETISINKKLTEDDIDSLMCSFVNLFGHSEVPHPENHTDKKVLMSQFKVNSHYIDIDNKSIIMNKHGQLQVNVDSIVDNESLVKALAENKPFMDKIKAHLDPGQITMNWVELYLLRDPDFMQQLTTLITNIQMINNGEIDSTIEDEIAAVTEIENEETETVTDEEETTADENEEITDQEEMENEDSSDEDIE